MEWSLMEVWNNALEKKERPIEARDRVYASELGGSMIDRYLKMRATPYTNPPNSRSMRKFMAGDIWEWIIKIVLVKCGITYRQQEKVLIEYEGLLPISGKVDFIAGGKPDYEKALAELEGQDIPDFIKNQAIAVIDYFKTKFPNGFEEKVIEMKSLGSFVFEALLATDNPKTHHMLQAFCYHKFTGLPTDIIYICRDDVRLLQYNINAVADYLEGEVKKDLETITYYHKNNIEPEKEKLIIWDENKKKFSLNWKVEYSVYLTKLYTYTNEDGIEKPIETPEEYRDYFNPKVIAWNRVVKRVVEDAEITKSNIEYVSKMQEQGFDLSELLNKPIIYEDKPKRGKSSRDSSET